MKKNKILLISFLFLLLATPQNVFATASCGANGIDASKWQYSETVVGTKEEADNIFHDLGSSGKKCCERGSTQTLQYKCDLYKLIDAGQSTPDPNRIYDEANAITCDYNLDNYKYDYTTSATSNLKKQTSSTTICCKEQAHNSGAYTCSFYVAKDVIENENYNPGGSAGTIIESEDSDGKREDLDDVTGDIENSCEAIFDDDAQALIKKLFQYICIGVPILLIVLGSVDFGNAVLSSDQEAMQKAVKRFTTRCIVAVAIFFLPMLVNLIFKFPGMDIVEGILFCEV